MEWGWHGGVMLVDERVKGWAPLRAHESCPRTTSRIHKRVHGQRLPCRCRTSKRAVTEEGTSGTGRTSPCLGEGGLLGFCEGWVDGLVEGDALENL